MVEYPNEGASDIYIQIVLVLPSLSPSLETDNPSTPLPKAPSPCDARVEREIRIPTFVIVYYLKSEKRNHETSNIATNAAL